MRPADDPPGRDGMPRPPRRDAAAVPRSNGDGLPPSAQSHRPVMPRRTLLTGAVFAAAGAVVARPGLARAATGAAAVTGGPVAGPAAHQITFDPYSLMIDGDRTFIWSGEFHPFRLPSPSLWFDVLQKMKASDCNAVSMYFNWSYHSPAPGDYDFTGVRDMDTALGMAADAGLYVIARPGPYINAEVNAGGYPGWLTTTAGRARTDEPTYLGYADEYHRRPAHRLHPQRRRRGPRDAGGRGHGGHGAATAAPGG